MRAAEITWSEPGRRLIVRSSQELPLRVVPLVVTVTAPAGSRLAARTGAGDVVVTGRAGWAAVRTGSGEVDLAAVDGDADVTTGSGDLVLGEVAGRARLRTGSGTIRLDRGGRAHRDQGGQRRRRARQGVAATSACAPAPARCASTTRAPGGSTSPPARASCGWRCTPACGPSWTSRPARAGRAATSTVNAAPPAEAVALHVRGRTGSGDVLVTRATGPPDRGPGRRRSPRFGERWPAEIAAARRTTAATTGSEPAQDMAAARGAAMSPRGATSTPESPSHSAITASSAASSAATRGAVDRGLGERALHPQHARPPGRP